MCVFILFSFVQCSEILNGERYISMVNKEINDKILSPLCLFAVVPADEGVKPGRQGNQRPLVGYYLRPSPFHFSVRLLR